MKKYISILLAAAMLICLLPTAMAADEGTIVLDLENNECISNYHGTIGWDATEKASYMETGDSNVQYKIDVASSIPSGKNWYRVSYKLKNATSQSIGSIGALFEESNYTNRILSITDYMSQYNSNIVYNGNGAEALSYPDARFVQDWTSDYVKVDYYINDENDQTNVYVYINNELKVSFTNPSATSKIGFMFFELNKASGATENGKAYIKDVVFGWSDEGFDPPSDPIEEYGSKKIDFSTGENVSAYKSGSVPSDSDYGYDESVGAGYFSTGDSQIQYQINGQNFVPSGYNWYKVTYTIKNAGSNQLGFLGRMSAGDGAGNNYANTIVTVADATTDYNTNIIYNGSDGNAGYFANDWTAGWTTISYYINDENGKTTVYLYKGTELVTSFENSSYTDTVGFMFFSLNANSKAYIKDVEYVWSTTEIDPPTESEEEKNKIETKTIDLSTGENTGAYKYGNNSSESTYVYDETEGAMCLTTGDSQIQYQIFGQNFVPSGYKWYKVTYTVKNAGSRKLGFLGRMSAGDGAGNNYANTIVSLGDSGNGKSTVYNGADSNVYTLENDWTAGWTTISYYINDENGKTTVYLYKGTELMTSFENPSYTDTVGFMFFSLDQNSKMYIKDIAYSWSNGKIEPEEEVVEESTVITKVLDLETGENISAYGEGSADSVYGYDESVGAGYYQTGDKSIQYQVNGQNFVPSGYKWYKVTYTVKNASDNQMGFLGRMSAGDGAGNNYANTIVTVADATTDYNTNIIYNGADNNAGYFANDWKADWTTITYYVNDENDTTTVYVYKDTDLVVSFKNPSYTDTVGFMFFSLNANSKAYIKDIAYSWSNNSLLPSKVDVSDNVDDGSIGFKDEYGTPLYTSTVGSKIVAYYDSDKIGQNSVSVTFTPTNKTETAYYFASGENELTITPTEEGVACITVTNVEGTVIGKYQIGVYKAIDSSLSELYNKGELKVAYLGGSITEGAGASPTSYRWSTQLTAWLNTLDLGSTSFTEVNAGIGGTPSDYGLLRLKRDVIQYEPDVVFVEFALNDESLSEGVSARMYEGIIRRLMAADKVPYIICVGVVANRTNKTRSALHRKIANNYGLQYIDVQEYMDTRMGEANPGTNTARDALYTSDNTHPNNNGYTFYTQCIESALNQGSFNKPSGDPLYSNYYDLEGKFINAQALDSTGKWTNYGAGNWSKEHLGSSGSGVYSSDSSSTLTYTFTGKIAVIGHRIGTDMGKMKVTLDGEETIVDCYYNTTNQHVTWFSKYDLEDTEHTISISPVGEKNSSSSDTKIKIDFLLVSSENIAPDEDEEEEENEFETYYWDGPDYVASSFDQDKTTESGTTIISRNDTQEKEILYNLTNMKQDGYLWNKVSYELKFDTVSSAFATNFGQLKYESGIFQTAFNATYDASSNSIAFQTGTGTDAEVLYTYTFSDKDMTEYTKIDYYIYHPASGNDLIFIGVDGQIAGPFELSVGNITYGRLQFTPATVLDGKVYLKNVSAGWGDTVDFETPELTVSSDIEDGATGVEIADGKVSVTLKFNYEIRDNIPLSSYITVNSGAVNATYEKIDAKTVKVTINEAESLTSYTVRVSKNIPVKNGQMNESGLGAIGMTKNYTLKFTTQPDSFDVTEVRINGSASATLYDYLGQNVNVEVDLRNNRYENAPALNIFVAITDSDGKMYSLTRTAVDAIAVGDGDTATFNVNVPSASRVYTLEVYTLTGSAKVLPLYKKVVK